MVLAYTVDEEHSFLGVQELVKGLTADYAVVAEPTPLYISPYIYPGTVTKEQLKPGQTVDILAKPKTYDWVLVGKDGIGIGYIPISRLTPAKR